MQWKRSKSVVRTALAFQYRSRSVHNVEEAYQHRNKSIAIFVRDSSTLHLRFGRSLYALYVLATLLTRSLRFHQITNIKALLQPFQDVLGVLTMLPLRFRYALGVLTALPLRSNYALVCVHGDLQHTRANQGINTSPVLVLSSLLNVI